MKFANFILLLVGAFVTIYYQNLSQIVYSNLFVLLAYFFFTLFIQSRFIRLYHAWIIAVLYIVIPEGIVLSSLAISDENIIVAAKYIFLANYMALIAHNLFYSETPIKFKGVEKIYRLELSSIIALAFLYFLFLLVSIPHAISIAAHGRVGNDGLHLPVYFVSIARASGYILPAIIAFVFKVIKRSNRYWIKTIVFSFPILFLLFLGGTRYPLLFSAGGMLIVLLSGVKLNIFSIVKFTPLIFFLSLSSTIMVSYRTFGLRGGVAHLFLNIFSNNSSSRGNVFGSIEGILYQSSIMIKYFNEHSFLFGKSSAFILYFWIPRTFWQEKPQMLGYWLMRDAIGNRGFSEGHSFAFGFMGDAYADFGFYGGLIVCFLFGLLLARLDLFVKKQIDRGVYFGLIISAMSYSYVFFFVRSPQTSTFNFLGIILIYLFIKFFIKEYRLLHPPTMQYE